MSGYRFAVLVFGLLAATLFVPKKLLALPDHTSYDVVLGQVRKDTRRINSPGERSMNLPSAVAIDRSHDPNALYVADLQNARVLGWRDVSRFKSGDPADLLIGQKDFFATERFRSDNRSFASPNGLAVDSKGTLWVADTGNGRVLGFKWPFDPKATPDDNVTADFLIGQADYGQGYYKFGCNRGYLYSGPAGDATDQSFCYLEGIAVDPDDNLYVADRQNNRVLMFKAPILDKDAHAALVFGQPSMNTKPFGNCNRGMMTPDGTTLCRPAGVLARKDGGGVLHLYVTDSDNSRVLIFDDPMDLKKSMGGVYMQSADRVVGQPNMTRGLLGSGGADRLKSPAGATLDRRGILWVSDTSAHRVLGFAPPFPAANGGASYVLGQPDAAGITPNQQAPGAKIVPPPTAATLSTPRIGDVDRLGRLYVPDQANHRVLIFDDPTQPQPQAQIVLGQDDMFHGADSRVKPRGMAYPSGIAIHRPEPSSGEPIHVYVADTGNSRVMAWWDLGALYDGKPADLILGQNSPMDYLCNMGKSVSDRTLCYPRGLFVDKNGDLWVADAWNNRVLRFRRPFKNPTRAADLVLGQSSFINGLINGDGNFFQPNARGLFNPSAVVIDGKGMVWVSDRDSDRVVGYAPPYSNGMPAARLLIGTGITGFDQLGCPKRTDGHYVCTPVGLALNEDDNLWVAERDNHRVSLYQTTPPDMTKPELDPTPIAVIGQKNATDGGVNAGVAAVTTAQSLFDPEGVSIEFKMNGDQKVPVAIVVADGNNNRVLTFDPMKQGFFPTANTVIGQGGLFTTHDYNFAQSGYEVPENLQKGLWYPGAVLAIPEALFIADTGLTSFLTAKAGAGVWQNPGNGNHRVLVLRGADYPPPGVDASVPPDLSGPPADMAVPVAGDLGSGPAPAPGCSCQAGSSSQAEPPRALYLLSALALVLLLALRRHRA